MRTNVLVETEPVLTHGGAVGRKFKPESELQRAVLTCLLWENTFYESGSDLAARIAELVKQVNPEVVCALAVRARSEYQLRHVPLFLVRELARVKGNGKYVEATLEQIIQRPDELGEFLSIYSKNVGANKIRQEPLSAAVKRGLASALRNFNAYQLSKWDLNNASIKLLDVIRLVHPAPKDADQSQTWKKLIAGTLETAERWETELSAGKDKKETFERLIKARRLGGMAFLRNLRNMDQSGVQPDLIESGLESANFDRVLPFRFIAAAKHAPRYEKSLQDAMLRASKTLTRLAGKTLLIVDTSGSMSGALSGKSDMNRIDAAAALAMLAKETCESGTLYATAGSDSSRVHATMLLPDRRGFALRDALQQAPARIGHGGIFLTQCMSFIAAEEHGRTFDRVIVFTDEQDCDTKLPPAKSKKLGRFNYLVNVASYKIGIGDVSGWIGINGFSERIFDYIAASENESQQN